MKTILNLLHAIAAGVAMIALAGCATAPNLDREFGNSVNTLKAQQIIDPNASANTKAVSMDGQAAGEVVDRYYKSYKTPTPQPNVFTIGVGAGGS